MAGGKGNSGPGGQLGKRVAGGKGNNGPGGQPGKRQLGVTRIVALVASRGNGIMYLSRLPK